MDYDELLMSVIVYHCTMINTTSSWVRDAFSVFPPARVWRGKVFCPWVSEEGMP